MSRSRLRNIGSIGVLMAVMALVIISSIRLTAATDVYPTSPRVVIIRCEDYYTRVPVGDAWVKLYKQPGDDWVWQGYTDKFSGETSDIMCDDNTYYTVTARKGGHYAGTTSFYSGSGPTVLIVIVYMKVTVGGIMVPVDKLGVLASNVGLWIPCIGLIAAAAAAGVVYTKRTKR